MFDWVKRQPAFMLGSIVPQPVAHKGVHGFVQRHGKQNHAEYQYNIHYINLHLSIISPWAGAAYAGPGY